MNKSVVGEFIQALFSRGDLTALDRLLDPGVVNHDPPIGVGADRDGMRQAAAAFRAAFPDWHSEVEMLLAEDDIVVERFTARGTHRGEMFGVPATGRAVVLPGINIFRLRDGLITERWGRLDELGLMRQLGLIPA